MTPQKKIIVVLGSALFLSLSANLFMGGLMLGQGYNKGYHRDGGRDWDKSGKEDRDARREEWKKRDAELRARLPEADRAIVEEHMKGMKGKFKTLRDAADAAEDKADAARAADPFDQQAYEAALKAQAEAKATLVGTLKSARKELMQKLSPEGQKVMKEMGPRFRGREGRDGGHDGWRKRRENDRGGDRGGRFFDRRPDGPASEGPRGENMRDDGPPPPPPGGEDGPPPPPPSDDVPPPPPGDAPPPDGEEPPAP